MQLKQKAKTQHRFVELTGDVVGAVSGRVVATNDATGEVIERTWTLTLEGKKAHNFVLEMTDEDLQGVLSAIDEMRGGEPPPGFVPTTEELGPMIEHHLGEPLDALAGAVRALRWQLTKGKDDPLDDGEIPF